MQSLKETRHTLTDSPDTIRTFLHMKSRIPKGSCFSDSKFSIKDYYFLFLFQIKILQLCEVIICQTDFLLQEVLY